MTGWHTQRLCTFDLESTSPNPEEARIVTACIAMVGGGRATEVSSWVADPGVDVPAEAAAIHGYDTARLQAEGKPLVDVLPEIVDTLAAAITTDVPVVIYNAPYDTTLLDRETRRFGMPPFGDLLGDAHIIDPLCIDRALDRYRKGKRTLTSTCEHYGVRLDGAHDSTFDALAAARIAWAIGQRSHLDFDALRNLYADRRFPDRLARDWQRFGLMSLAEVHAAQIGWYREQAESLGAYWIKERDTLLVAADVDEPPPVEGLPDAGREERRDALLGQGAELADKIASLRFEWPLAVMA